MATSKPLSDRDNPAPTAAFYTERQFRRVYPIGHTKFWNEVKGGHLNISRLGRRAYVPRAEAERWAATRLSA